MKLFVNGKERIFDGVGSQTLSDLLGVLNVDEATVVAEVEGVIIPREQFGEKKLADENKIELVRFVPGG